VGVEHVVALPGVHRQPGRQAGAGGQPAPGRHLDLSQAYDGAVLGGVREHLGGGHAQPGTAAGVQRVTVHNVLLDGGQRLGGGQSGEAAQRRWAAGGRRLRGPGQGQVGDAVVQLDGEPGGTGAEPGHCGAGQAGGAQQRGRVVVRPAVDGHGEARRRVGEWMGRGGVPGEDRAAGEDDAQPPAGDMAGGHAGDGLAGQRAPEPGEDGRAGPGQRRLVRRHQLGAQQPQLGQRGRRIGHPRAAVDRHRVRLAVEFHLSVGVWQIRVHFAL
jgi:hypothetical protein